MSTNKPEHANGETGNESVSLPATAPAKPPADHSAEQQNVSSEPSTAPGTPAQPSSTSHSPPDHRDVLRGNPYSDALEARGQPDLEKNLARMGGGSDPSTNRKALGLFACIVMLLVVMGYWVLTDNRSEPTHTAAQESVTVPDAPEHAPVGSLDQERPTEALAIGMASDTNGVRRPSLAEDKRPDADKSDSPMQNETTLLERRIAASNGGTTGIANAPSREIPGFQIPPGAFGVPPAAKPSLSSMNNLAYTADELPNISTANPLPHPDAVMLQGTLIRCVLQTRIITDIPGFTSCVVTEPVYSFTGKRLLLPKGSKVMGKYRMEPNGPRVAVIWDRIVTPGGVDVNMASPGIDDLGGAGHPGHYSAHWGQRISSALLISLLSDAFKYAAAEHGPRTTTITNGLVTQSPFESDTADTLHDIASAAVRRGADRPATVTINQGSILAIYVARDVDFTAVVATQ